MSRKPKPLDDTLYQEIGKRLQAKRKHEKISQQDLAWSVGFERATSISEIEHGKNRVQVDTLYRLAQLLDCSIYELLPESLIP